MENTAFSYTQSLSELQSMVQLLMVWSEDVENRLRCNNVQAAVLPEGAVGAHSALFAEATFKQINTLQQVLP